VTLFRLQQQMALLTVVTAMFFVRTSSHIFVAIVFLLVELSWQCLTVVSIHAENVDWMIYSVVTSPIFPLYSIVLLTQLSRHPFFISSLMFATVSSVVVFGISMRICTIITLHRIRLTFGKGFKSRVMPKLNLLALALPIRVATYAEQASGSQFAFSLSSHSDL
jgi:hypothetical protein